MSTIHRNHHALKLLLTYWSKQNGLEDFHIHWARSKLKLVRFRRHQEIFLRAGDRHSIILVTKGMIAQLGESSEENSRNIKEIDIAGMVFSTTTHLFSRTPAMAKLIALRSGDLLLIPYRELLKFSDRDPKINELIRILFNRKLRTLSYMNRVNRLHRPLQRYQEFSLLFPEIRNSCSYREQADLLSLSKSTVNRFCKRL